MTASITAGAATASADLLTDLKSGYLLGASPRRHAVVVPVVAHVGVHFAAAAAEASALRLERLERQFVLLAIARFVLVQAFEIASQETSPTRIVHRRRFRREVTRDEGFSLGPWCEFHHSNQASFRE